MLSIQTDLATTFADVLEAMAFLSPAPLESGAACPAEGVLVRMRFAGGGGGVLAMATGLELGGAISDMLLDAPDTPEIRLQRSTDALKELLNVFTGELLRRGGVVDPGLDLPTVDDLPDEVWQRLLGDEQCTRLDVDGVPVLLKVCSEEAAC